MDIREIERDGVAVAYRVRGAGPDVVLLPAWQLVDSRMWDLQVAALSGSARVITHDARGSGRSGRPRDPAAYAAPELVADALAVLDATGTERAVLVGQSFGGGLALMLAALHPDRVAGLVMVGATVNLGGDADAPIVAAGLRFDEDLGPRTQGWDRYNRHAWGRDFPGFVRWFVDSAAPEPHVAGLREQAVAWGLEQDPTLLATVTAARFAVPPAEQAVLLRALADRITCPAVVVHGDRDAIVPPAWGAALASRLGAEHIVLPGAGHCPHLSYPDAVASAVAGLLQRSPA